MNQFYQSIFHTKQKNFWIVGQPQLDKFHAIIKQDIQEGFIQIQDKNGKFQDRPQYILKDQYLISDDKYIDLVDLRVRLIKYQQLKGIQFHNEESYLDIYGSPHVIDRWFGHIKFYTIQDKIDKHYQFVKLLGRGSHAKVYQVKHKKTKQSFALKQFVKHKVIGKDEIVYSIFNEIKILRQLSNHHSIIKLFEVFEDDQFIFIILELLEGGELFENLSKNHEEFNETDLKELMQNILEALRHMHQRNIMHRDIKPENLILRRKADIANIVIFLSDFYNDAGTYKFTRCGTVGYVAPEILKDQKYDMKVDVFSTGVILYQLLSGSNPFQSESSDKFLQKNYNCEVDFNKVDFKLISPLGLEFLKLLLQEDPKLRPTAGEALLHEWFLDNTKFQQHNQDHKTTRNICQKNLTIPIKYPFIQLQVKCRIDRFTINNFSEQYYFQQISDEQESVIEKYDIQEDEIEESPTAIVKQYEFITKRRSIDCQSIE
ncbi:hypothetical protein pb186bvf_007329 [Paramecium bursaria]